MCAAPSAKGDDKFITTDYLQQCPKTTLRKQPSEKATFISFFPAIKGAEIIPCTGIRKDFGSALALPP
jgi:hypothetical protein